MNSVKYEKFGKIYKLIGSKHKQFITKSETYVDRVDRVPYFS